MKRVIVTAVMVSVPLMFGSYAGAEEAADRNQIDKVIAALNVTPEPAGLFTDDALLELDKLPQPARTQFQPVTGSAVSAAQPAVAISREPWGEARINLGGLGLQAAAAMVNPHISTGTTRFVSADVAMVDGKWTYTDGGSTQTVPLLFVMRREGDAWKIASARLLATR